MGFSREYFTLKAWQRLDQMDTESSFVVCDLKNWSKFFGRQWIKPPSVLLPSTWPSLLQGNGLLAGFPTVESHVYQWPTQRLHDKINVSITWFAYLYTQWRSLGQRFKEIFFCCNQQIKILMNDVRCICLN